MKYRFYEKQKSDHTYNKDNISKLIATCEEITEYDENLYDKVYSFLDFIAKINFSNGQIVVPGIHGQF